MGFIDDLKEKIGQAVLDTFDSLTPDLRGIHNDARGYTRTGWQTFHTSAVGIGGAAFTAIPGLHLAGLVPDAIVLVNRMAVCSYGIGAIMAKERGLDFILEREDMHAILARWSGDDSLDNASLAKLSAAGSMAFASAPIGTTFAQMAVKNSGILIGKKFGGKIGGKISAKFLGKYGGKLVSGMIPFVGPTVCAGINVWFISEMCSAASGWYEAKIKHIGH